jgi:hypothetical protein
MVGLGSSGDVPPNAEQPALADGIHLRWAFKRELGFPWFGFYLFRRLHDPGTLSWLSQHTGQLPKGPWSSNSLDTPLGRVVSDKNLMLTDDFAPQGSVEFDLADRSFLDVVFPQAEPVRRIQMRIGFRQRAGDPPPTKTTVSFTGRTAGAGPNPRTENGVVFEARDSADRPRPNTFIRSIQTPTGTVTGLGCKFKLNITLPQAAKFVEVTLTGAGRRNSPDGSPTIEAINEDGTRAEIATMQDPSSRLPETFLLVGSAIKRVVIDERLVEVEQTDDQDRLILNEITFGNATISEIQLTAYASTTPVRSTKIRGYAGRIVTSELEFEGITVLEITSAPAALIDLGTVPLSQGATSGWTQLSQFTYPLRLPLTHPDYPCTPQLAEDFSSSRQLATSRIQYGSSQQFTGSPVLITNAGTVSVTKNSPIVVGTSTNWTNDLLDAVLQVSGDTTVYTVAMVVSPTKLVLSRNYSGATRSGAQYAISRDKYGQFYNYLVNLVAGGNAAGAMVNRTLPAPVTTAGTVALTKDSATVQGTGTAWSTSLAGLDIQLSGEDTVYRIATVESATQLTLDRPYPGDSKTGQTYRISARFQASTVDAITPRMPEQSPLDMVVLGSLHPAVAQMSGLYWIDPTADPDQTYDYLIVGDNTGVAQLNPANMLALIQQSGFANVDGSIVYNLRASKAPALTSPNQLEVYALPGSSRRIETGSSEESINNVGLRWNLDKTPLGALLPGRAIMYHVWRANLGNGTTPNAPSRYDLITKNWPVLVVDTGVTPDSAPDWPNFSLHAFDNALSDGWYSYQVSGIDIFGRHTPNSVAGAWRQWSPVPEPRPWYYLDPPSDAVIHASAIRLLTKTAPPPPTGVEAYALDPADVTVIKDAAYSQWLSKLTEAEKKNLIGLRVRWQWPQAQMDQAPHTREFRIYFQPGQLNAVLGNTLAVTASSATESNVTTDIPNNESANSFVGAALYAGDDAFVVVGSEAGSPLRVRVRNVGPKNNITPPANTPCTIAIPPAYTAGLVSVANGSKVVTGDGTGWTASLGEMMFQVATEERAYRIESVTSASQLVLEEPYAGLTKGDRVYNIQHPRFVDYTAPVSWQRRYYVVNVDQNWTAGTDASGQPVRNYEVFLPVPEESVHDSVPLTPSRSEPIVYAHVGVSAADDKTYTLDNPKWTGPWAARTGNEGRIGPPAKIFRVLREAPPAPILPRMPERLLATRADQNGNSFYTFRWQPLERTATYVFRAFDDAVFQTDWSQRPRPALDPTKLELFPSEATDPRWTAAKRQQVATELNQLNSFAHDAGGTTQAFNYYRGLSADALRILAGLPGNDDAFTQITVTPLVTDDPANANRRGPDDPDNFQIGDPSNPLASPSLRAFVDSVDGHVTNRYFYRAAYVDAAQNRSALSLATPPLTCPDLAAPEAPVITRVLGGDHRVMLRWTQGRVDGVNEFLIYRTDQADRATDQRFMTLLTTMPSLKRIAIVAGATHFRSPFGVQQLLGVYRRDQGNPAAVPPHAQPPTAVNFWQQAGSQAVMVVDDDGYGAQLYGLGALAENTELIIVFRDAKGVERLVDRLPLEFVDESTSPAHDYFYCVSALRLVGQNASVSGIQSPASKIVRGRATGLPDQTA